MACSHMCTFTTTLCLSSEIGLLSNFLCPKVCYIYFICTYLYNIYKFTYILSYYSGKGGKNRRRGKNEGEAKRELAYKDEGQGNDNDFIK